MLHVIESSEIQVPVAFTWLMIQNTQVMPLSILACQGTFLDEATGLKKKETPLVVASVTPKPSVSGSWNKKVRPA